LQVLDDGRLTDNQGRTVNFKNAIIIMTSNLGSQIIQERLLETPDDEIENVMGELRGKLIELLRKSIRPEFLNRIDEVVLFKTLTKTELRQIVDIQTLKVKEMLAAKEMEIEIDDEAKDWIVKIGYDAVYGARPLKRTIQKYLTNPLSQQLLMGNYSAGDTIKVTLGDRGLLEFSKS